MRRALGTIAAMLATAAVVAGSVEAGPHDRHLYPNSLGSLPAMSGGWPDGTARNSN